MTLNLNFNIVTKINFKEKFKLILKVFKMSEKKRPKVSVIVPVYNVEEYLPTCLDSLINQTLREIEIICVNDGSTDKSLSILQSYAKKDNRIIIINKENSGPGDSRNVALNCVNGEFVLFVDGDDWIDKKTCSVCYEKAKENDVDFISFNANIVCGDDVKPYYYYGMKEDKTVIFNDVERKIFYERFHSCHYCFKSSFLNENKIRYPQLFLCEDVPFILRCWLEAKKVYCIADCFYNYVQRQSSITHVNTHMMDIFPVLKQIEVLLNKYQKTNKRLFSDFSNWKLQHLMWVFKILKKTQNGTKCLSCCKQICTKSEYKKLIAECGFFVKLFNKIPLFELECKKNKRIYKILNCAVLVVYKKCRKSIRKDKEDFKKWYKLFGFPIIKIKKKYYFNGYKKLIYFCGLCVYKNFFKRKLLIV